MLLGSIVVRYTISQKYDKMFPKNVLILLGSIVVRYTISQKNSKTLPKNMLILWGSIVERYTIQERDLSGGIFCNYKSHFDFISPYT